MRITLGALLILLTASAGAQAPVAVVRQPLPVGQPMRLTTTEAIPRAEGGSFLMEAAAGAVGSAAGIGLGLLVAEDCPSEDDITCAFGTLTVVGTLGIAGATIGNIWATRHRRERRSIPGAVLGAAVGAVAGVGIHHLIKEEMNTPVSDAATLAIFAVSQGAFAAAGSRVLGTARR